MFNPTPLEISKAIRSPFQAVKDNWPVLEAALNTYQITKDSGRIAVLATISVEARAFQPIKEYGNDHYFHRMYDITSPIEDRRDVARQLGNLTPGDGIRYCGRGFVQTTGLGNYRETGKAIGLDLVAHPELLLKVQPAALAMGHYMRSRGADVWAEKAIKSTLKNCGFCALNGLIAPNGTSRRPRGNDVVCSLCGWKTVRRIVNGGLTHFNEFKTSVDNLIKLVK